MALPDDDPGQPRHRRQCLAGPSSDATPPEAMTGQGATAATAASPSTVGPDQRTVAADVRHDERLGRREVTEHVGQPAPAALGPAVHGQLATAMIEPDRDRHDLGDGADELRRLPAPRSPSRPSPRPRRASAPASSTLRTPPPACTRARPATAAVIASTTGRLTGSPLRAASRSTTWIQDAPAAAKPSAQRDGVVAVDRLLVVVPPEEADGAAGPKVDGRVQIHGRAVRS